MVGRARPEVNAGVQSLVVRRRRGWFFEYLRQRAPALIVGRGRKPCKRSGAVESFNFNVPSGARRQEQRDPATQPPGRCA